MNKKYYDLLGVTEEMTDEEITDKFEELKKKYSEDRFLEGEAGNEAAKMLNKIDVAYSEIMAERRESRMAGKTNSSYTKVDELIRDGKFAEAQAALDEFNERPAEWHYLQSVVFYRKNWMNESKKQLEIAIQMDGANSKYREAYDKLKARADYRQQSGGAPNTNPDPNMAQGGEQMGGNWCANCASMCYTFLCVNCLFNLCCNCH